MRDTGGGLADPIDQEVDAAGVNDRPTLTQHKVVLSSTETGKAIRFVVIAHNIEG
jgi:hypothetical protein